MFYIKYSVTIKNSLGIYILIFQLFFWNFSSV